jgi:hypothetical protein
MNAFVTPDRIINLDLIAYVERLSVQPSSVRIYFGAPAALKGSAGGLELELRGADADLLINQLTRKPSEEPGMP